MIITALSVILPAKGSGQDTVRVSTGRVTDTTEISRHSDHENAPVVQAARVRQAIAIDGKLTDAGWTAAIAVSDFTQLDPIEGTAVSEATEVRVLFDDQALYIGARLADSRPPSTRLGRRDAFLTDSDFFIVLIDSYHDHRSAFRFAINPSGVKRDEILSGGGERRDVGGGETRTGGDTSWEPVWQVATAVDGEGWTAELRIPFSQLRFSSENLQTWGIQFERRIIRTQEHAQFAFTPKTERGGVARYGHLRGLEGIRTGKRLELVPYVAARAEYRTVPRNPAAVFSNPYRAAGDRFASSGIDMKYRLTTNFTLNATVNPDFGQVELDPAVVNLTAFETRFDEKRPFFVEGAEIFRFGGGGGGGGGPGGGGGGPGGGGGGGGGEAGGGGPSQLLYPRRIGRPPQGAAPAGSVYADLPAATTIAGALKLTGRTPAGWSMGVLDAVTPRETAAFINAGQVSGSAAVEPLTNYFAGRLRRDLRAGQTTVGALVTSVHRDLQDEPLALLLRRDALAGGLDFSTDWAKRVWSLDGYLSSSLISGRRQVITAAQRSSARYFQRPDASHLDLDSSATSMGGYAARIDFGKRAGLWLGGASMSATSPAYEINDLGFQSTADRISFDTNLTYSQNRPRSFYRRWNLRVNPEADWNYGGERIKTTVGMNLSGQLVNYWSGGIGVSREFATLDDRLTRGGPLTRRPAGFNLSGMLFTDFRKPYAFTLFTNYSQDEAGSSRASANFSANVRPAQTWDVRIAPNISRSHAVAQYVTTLADATATETFGRRYIFGDLQQTTVGIETRLNLTFTPELTLEVYAQPFFSAGDYENFKQLRAPRTYDFARFGRDLGTASRTAEGNHLIDPDGQGPAPKFTLSDRDFNFLSVRGNAVARWEWRPGSTLFLVWQQNRSRQLTLAGADPDYTQVGNFELGRDARELFGLKPDNVFLLKVTYWLNP